MRQRFTCQLDAGWVGQPYADAIGREYRVVGNVIATAWNDSPDKETILSITLSSPPGYANRFVSWTVPLQQGQVVRITGGCARSEAV